MSIDFSAFGLRPVASVVRDEQQQSPSTAGPVNGSSPLSMTPSEGTSPICRHEASPEQLISQAILSDNRKRARHDDVADASSDDDRGSLFGARRSTGGSSSADVDAGPPSKAALRQHATDAPSHPIAASALFQRGRISATDKDAASVLFWALDLTKDSVDRVQHSLFVRHAVEIAAAAWPTTFRFRDAAYCSVHFAPSYNEKHLSVFEGAKVRLSPKELLLLDDGKHLLLTFDALEQTMLPMLSHNVPLFALIGSVDVLHGFQSARFALIRLLRAREDAVEHRPALAEHGVVSWVLRGGGGMHIDSVLMKHMRGAFAA